MGNNPFTASVKGVVIMKRKKLFLSLCLFYLIPFLYQCVRTSLIADIPSALDIAGNMEWFDLFNETLQAFLIVPLYHLLKDDFNHRVKSTFLLSTALYTVFSVIIIFLAQYAVEYMTGAADYNVIQYLQLEMLAFIFGYIASYTFVVFVVQGAWINIIWITVAKCIMTILGDLFFIPRFGINGVALSNMAISFLLSLIGFLCIKKCFKTNIDLSICKSLVKIGLWSGWEILLNNLIYSFLVCRMVNEVAEQGSYWIANNFIWGLLLIPTMAVGEIIKKEKDKSNFLGYIRWGILIDIIWVLSIPAWELFLRKGMGIGNPGKIVEILHWLVPFYCFYNFSTIIQSVFIAYGKTKYNYEVSVIVNLAYYPIMYILFKHGIFQPGIRFICLLFGFGMVINCIFSIILFKINQKSL